jgi:hypothetical protein
MLPKPNKVAAVPRTAITPKRTFTAPVAIKPAIRSLRGIVDSGITGKE